MQALVVATGAGFTTTSSLLSWLIYSLVNYDGMQERLLQELIDNDINAIGLNDCIDGRYALGCPYQQQSPRPR